MNNSCFFSPVIIIWTILKEVFTMSVPESVRKVARPVNTIVEDSGRDTKYRYAVRERGEIVYENGSNPRPKNGKVIGHIIDGVFVPRKEKTAEVPNMFSYGAAAFAHFFTNDIYMDLLSVYPIRDAVEIIAIAILKVIKPKIACNRYSTEYERTFVNVWYPGCAMSKNSITEFYKRIGMDSDKRRLFQEKRLSAVCKQHHIAIDGTLRQDNSSVNDLSSYSRKARVKGTRDISILYAFDTETGEPLCSEVYPGNNIDAITVTSFIKDNSIQKGIIVADKGFPLKNIKEALDKNNELHYLLPLKRGAKLIKDNCALTWDKTIHFGDRVLLCCKKEVNDKKYLYSFRDVYRAGKEDMGYVENSIKKEVFDLEKYQKQKDSFGTIVFISDLDLSEKEVYKIYSERWLLELMFAQYKGDEGLTTTNVQGDFSVIGEEFVNFIATILTSRMTKKADETGLLDTMSYGELMDDLSSAWRGVKGESVKPKDNDNYWIHTLPSVMEILVKLDIATCTKVKRNPGRPRKQKPVSDKPKRPRGRPRKKS